MQINPNKLFLFNILFTFNVCNKFLTFLHFNGRILLPFFFEFMPPKVSSSLSTLAVYWLKECAACPNNAACLIIHSAKAVGQVFVPL